MKAIAELRPSKNLARAIQCKKAPVIFERSERPVLHAKLFPTKKGITCQAGSSLRSRMTDICLRMDERIGFSKVSIPKSRARRQMMLPWTDPADSQLRTIAER